MCKILNLESLMRNLFKVFFMKASVTLYFIKRFHLIQETSFLAMIPIHLIILIEGEKKIYMPKFM